MSGTDGCIRHVLSNDGGAVKVVDDCHERTGVGVDGR